jgi:hypothetical protein
VICCCLAPTGYSCRCEWRYWPSRTLFFSLITAPYATSKFRFEMAIRNYCGAYKNQCRTINTSRTSRVVEHIAFETDLESRTVKFIFFSTKMKNFQMNVKNGDVQSDRKRNKAQSSCQEMFNCISLKFEKEKGCVKSRWCCGIFFA